MFEQTPQKSQQDDNYRVAWLIPSLRGGNYWHPVLSEFTRQFTKTLVYTAQWSGYAAGFENEFVVEVIGEQRLFKAQSTEGYNRNFIILSPKVIIHLLKFKPDVIFTNGFSLWTLLSILFKPIGKWRVTIAYEGSAPNIDCRDSQFRTFCRRIMAKWGDAFVTNSKAGKLYLTEVLGAQPELVFAQPYEVPVSAALLQQVQNSHPEQLRLLPKPIFLFVGQLIPRKGIRCLLKACATLKTRGRNDYTLLIIGEGEQRQELEAFSKEQDLPVKWLGWVDYGSLGNYFKVADVFVLPTIEDTWGMVVLEAMVFSKPILCSTGAGASEMVIEGENGYLFEPENIEELAKSMCRFMDGSDIAHMGSISQKLIAQYTPKAAAKFLADVTYFAFGSCEVTRS
ncbi:glycosyltransferase family 4 protein [Brunnivagina elsteri]|uniref:Glycosyl transferase n=1 Tax=Brunnivagina elsteri CCALA 953 TaxID=987040 RepID=A0A2A2TJ20_9CYAN|nr:glycosyltransferase family 4 protein [Calothrix elsteri]PAX54860.1 glycosyl transferase [Calothrix elsteri CCALA 953]